MSATGTLANRDTRARTLFLVNILHNDGTERSVRVRAHSVHGALLRALNGGAYYSAEVCDSAGNQLAVYDSGENQ